MPEMDKRFGSCIRCPRRLLLNSDFRALSPCIDTALSRVPFIGGKVLLGYVKGAMVPFVGKFIPR